MQKILLIGNLQQLQENIGELLLLNHYNVIQAADGKTGIMAAQAQHPDMILCEMSMNGIDGLGVLGTLRKDPSMERVPVIFLGDKYNARLFRTAMNLGADDYLISPFSNNDLLLTVESRLQRYQYQAAASGPAKATDEHDLKKLIREFTENRNTMRVAAHETVYKEGGTPRYLYYIREGKVKTVKTHEDGKDLVIGLYKKGDFFGYVALLEETPYKATAVVMEDAEIVLIPRKDAEEIFNRTPYIVTRFVRMLAQNVTEKEERLLGIAYDTLRKKVASALVHLRNKYQVTNTRNFVINISREELATVAGTATESLIRTLSDFKNEKLISIRNGSITILEAEKLEDIAFR
ncbi:MAG: cyclic nucleotide-binding domain-containing protein [Chitinophaga sp.]|uniref:cyclic nucleotide-binding domain-containing protein n=1 Tax=Chitinophaga sp. TaxID=1869181 RepID=UPI001B056417|nr:cyclic nucleotide-binding domain-containing protein [Chitinophaga sp.]MBO9732587.1 cyclic nucleotide-binding domain-containing protein [Chitinophaga sp.]